MTRPDPARARRAAVFCGAENDITGALCARLDGHSGTHSSDGGDAWVDADEPNTPGRTR